MEARLHFWAQIASQLAPKMVENLAIIWLSAKLKNTIFGLYLLCFRWATLESWQFSLTFSIRLQILSQEGVWEATFPYFEHFRLHFGTQISSLFSIISGLEKEAEIGLLHGISSAEFSAWVRLGGNQGKERPVTGYVVDTRVFSAGQTASLRANRRLPRFCRGRRYWNWWWEHDTINPMADRSKGLYAKD